MSVIRNFIFFIISLILFVPLVFCLSFQPPYIFTQVILFKSLLALVFIPSVWVWIYQKSDTNRLTPQSISLLILLIALFISAIFGVDYHTSLVGSWQRFGSVLDWVFVVIFYFVLATTVKKKNDWLRLFDCIVIVATLVSLIAVFQHFHLFNVFYSGTRVFSTIGNPGFLSGYILLTMGITVYMAIVRIRSRLLSTVYGLSFVLQGIILFLTQTRTSLIGFITVLIFTGLMFYKRASSSLPARKITRMMQITASVIFLIALSVGMFYFLSGSQQSIFSPATVYTRMSNWRIATQGFIERPFLGWGEENYTTVFFRNYDPGLYQGEDQRIFDSAHNEFFDRLVLGGILGFVSYVIFLIVPFYTIIKKKKILTSENLILIAFLLAYYVYLLAFFHSITDVIVLILYVAFFNFQFKKNINDNRKIVMHPSLHVVSIIIGIGLMILVSGKSVFASALVRSGVITTSPSKALYWFETAWEISKQSHGIVIREIFDAVVHQSGYSDEQYRRIDKLLSEELHDHPIDPVLWKIAVQYYRLRSITDPELSETALRSSDAFIALAPKYPYAYQLKGLLYDDQQKALISDSEKKRTIDLMIQMYETAVSLAPDVEENQILLLYASGAESNDGEVLYDYIAGYVERPLTLSTREWHLALESLYELDEIPKLEELRAQIHGTSIDQTDDPEVQFRDSVVKYIDFLVGNR